VRNREQCTCKRNAVNGEREREREYFAEFKKRLLKMSWEKAVNEERILID
jgi:hypothetical protein